MDALMLQRHHTPAGHILCNYRKETAILSDLGAIWGPAQILGEHGPHALPHRNATGSTAVSCYQIIKIRDIRAAGSDYRNSPACSLLCVKCGHSYKLRYISPGVLTIH